MNLITGEGVAWDLVINMIMLLGRWLCPYEHSLSPSPTLLCASGREWGQSRGQLESWAQPAAAAMTPDPGESGREGGSSLWRAVLGVREDG